MKRKPRKRTRRWNFRFDPGWYSSDELARFVEGLHQEISQKSGPLHERVAQLARVETELQRRKS